MGYEWRAEHTYDSYKNTTSCPVYIHLAFDVVRFDVVIKFVDIQAGINPILLKADGKEVGMCDQRWICR